MNRLLPAVAVLSVFTLAVCFILIPTVSVELKIRLGLKDSAIGTLTSIFFLTCMVAQFLLGPLVDRYGHKRVAIIGFLCAGLSVFMVAFAPGMAFLKLAVVFLGCGAICCNTVGNTLLPVVLFGGREPARASNLGNGFVGLAFIVVPLAFVTLLGWGWSFELALSLIAALVMGFAVVAAIPPYPAVATGFVYSMAVALLRQPAVLLAALALLCYLGLEIAISTWTRTLMTGLGHAAGDLDAARHAGWVLSLFGLAMALGRFASSAIKNLTKIGTWVIAGCALVAILAIGALTKATRPLPAAAAVVVIGLALAPIFATIVGVTFARFDPHLYGSIFGIIFSVGLIGPAFLPGFIAKLSRGRTIQQSLPAAMGAAALLLVLALLMGVVKQVSPAPMGRKS
jgi:fucose permease